MIFCISVIKKYFMNMSKIDIWRTRIMSNRQYEDKMPISGVNLDMGFRTGAVDFREKYNEMMANATQRKRVQNVFGNGSAATSVNKASTDFNG